MKKRTKWTDDMLAAEAAKYQTRKEFSRGNKNAYAAARDRHLLDKICGHMTTRYTTWTYDLLATEAAKYQTRKEFGRGNEKAYQAARSRKLLDEICGHMKKMTYWTADLVYAEATKYQTRSEFQRRSQSAYRAAKRLNLLDQICAHMVDGLGSDNDAIYIWRAVRMSYNGESVYKIGVTSARLGNRRIKDVAQESGFDYELILCQPVQGKATELEKKLHLLGEDPKLSGFSGCTEFRALSDSALEAAVALISLNKCQDRSA